MDSEQKPDEDYGGFFGELETLINKYSQENLSNTPDFVLAEYIKHSLIAFNNATRIRDKWYGHNHTIGNDLADTNPDTNNSSYNPPQEGDTT